MSYGAVVESAVALDDVQDAAPSFVKAGWLSRVASLFYRRPVERKRELMQRLQELEADMMDAPPSLTCHVLRGELLLELDECGAAQADFDAALELAEKFDPTAGWGVMEQVMRDRALQGLDAARRRSGEARV